MINLLTVYLQKLRAFHSAQSGTALTEFVITIPVYLIFFSGIITLYQIQEIRLFSQQSTSAELWKNAIKVQTKPVKNETSENDSEFTDWRMVPGPAAAETAKYYAATNESLSVTGLLDTGTAAMGMYFDSGVKTEAINLIPLLNANVSPDPQTDLASEIMHEGSHAYNLMNDQMLSNMNSGGGGILGIVSMALNATGARPGIAAGIRYGIVGAYDKTNYGVAPFDNTKLKTRYAVSAPTKPSERWVALALSRIEMSVGHDGYDELLAFGIGTGGGDKPDRVKAPNRENHSCGDSPVNTDIDPACEQQIQAYEACRNACDANPDEPCDCAEPEDCGNAEEDIGGILDNMPPDCG